MAEAPDPPAPDPPAPGPPPPGPPAGGGATRRVAVGVVRGVFGLRGEVYVHPDPDVAEVFRVGATYQTRRPDGSPGPRPLTVTASSTHRNRTLLRFADVDDRAAAVALRDLVLVRPGADDDLGLDDYWADELVGRPVVSAGGAALGVVRDIRDGPAHDWIVVEASGGAEHLVPAVADLVRVEVGRVVLADLPGLLDPDPDPSRG